ncbi:MAG: class III extradiol ring-cleavage dioxygenase [Gallionella sp.]
MPVVFVSHGAPDALLNAPDSVACWQKLGMSIPKPSAILMVSAHWEMHQTTVSLSAAPETIHDFSGFSPALYQMQYRAPGAPDLAKRVLELLARANIAATAHPNRGLDHGAWVPLMAMYPNADVPVMQLSLVGDASAATHYELGRALSALRDENVLIIASGAITHNFSWLSWRAEKNQTTLLKAQTFTDWVAERVAAKDMTALLNYRTAQYGAEAHPSEEHFLPLLFALGAARDSTPVRYQPDYTYGALAMDAYVWRD